ncbi:zinc finger protein 728-like [Acanthaster planci]|uniref:Zinc finger protein 728-like n=1 Tax=Acanthaster planci TaxID=133434 RepID=A0A8B7XWH9_ACAPL|nr:zinc finger protein 728-like [Acanthaster planci]XP_022085230.1 zinc finger protein 728-like [Acanthaster planci]
MKFIENPDLREWVKENLRREVFQKAHELAVQTGCEILVKLQDTTDHCGQYYATRTLHLQYQDEGLSKQPWDVQVSGVTGLPEVMLVERGCQSERQDLQEKVNSKMDEELMDGSGMAAPRLLEEDPNHSGSLESNRGNSTCFIDSRTQNSFDEGTDAPPHIVKMEKDDSFQTELHSLIQPDSDSRSDGVSHEGGHVALGESETGECHACGSNLYLDCGGNDAAATTTPSSQMAATYPIGFPMRKLQSLTNAVDTSIQTPFPRRLVPGFEAQNPPMAVTRSSSSVDVDKPASKPYQCGICKKTFGSIQILSRHAQLNHGLDRRMIFLCDVCGQGYKLAQHLQRHMRMHRTVMPYVCPVCNKGFFNGTSLTKHKKIHNEQLNERHQCQSGEGSGIRTQDFSLSEITTSGRHSEATPENQPTEDAVDESPGAATQCGHFPADVASLLHVGPSTTKPIFPQNTDIPNKDQCNPKQPSSAEEPYQNKDGELQIMSWEGACISQEPEVFHSITPVSSSQITQGGSRQSLHGRNARPSSSPCRLNRHVCHLCGKSYKYNFTLKEHLLTHASVPQFTCRICGTPFTRQRQLRDHMFHHSGKYPYHCELCGKGFIRPSILKKHQTRRHRMLHNEAQ